MTLDLNDLLTAGDEEIAEFAKDNFEPWDPATDIGAGLRETFGGKETIIHARNLPLALGLMKFTKAELIERFATLNVEVKAEGASEDEISPANARFLDSLEQARIFFSGSLELIEGAMGRLLIVTAAMSEAQRKESASC
jgi:hypothetical protein